VNRRAVALAAFDTIALVLLYYVFQDLAARVSYVESEPGLSSSTSYSFFIRVFTINGATSNGVMFPLVSPPALDWVQVILALLVVVNGLFLFSALRKHGQRPV